MSTSLKILQVKGVGEDFSMDLLELIIQNNGSIINVQEDPNLKKSVLIECTTEEGARGICQKLNDNISSGKQLTLEILPSTDEILKTIPINSSKTQNMLIESENQGSEAQEDPNTTENLSRRAVTN
eukprot:CAMPEP_0176426446 /NCGR_PEP_ID=MMETSP0127-20121128/11948_1 /TAXON_ID=938130 /ORGANISM="Platyophrya macrostoma, Strain WH" /LENGTH=125 /DNA_ID=CAMNT_0017807717 /DNA_START=32 /DNA_END=406 /DNA_ORIENTATION=-